MLARAALLAALARRAALRGRGGSAPRPALSRSRRRLTSARLPLARRAPRPRPAPRRPRFPPDWPFPQGASGAARPRGRWSSPTPRSRRRWAPTSSRPAATRSTRPSRPRSRWPSSSRPRATSAAAASSSRASAGKSYALDFRETAPAPRDARHVPRARRQGDERLARGLALGGRAGQRRGALGGVAHARLEDEDVGRAARAGDRARRSRASSSTTPFTKTIDDRAARASRMIPASAALFLPERRAARRRDRRGAIPISRTSCGASPTQGPAGFYEGPVADAIARRDEGRRRPRHGRRPRGLPREVARRRSSSSTAGARSSACRRPRRAASRWR